MDKESTQGHLGLYKHWLRSLWYIDKNFHSSQTLNILLPPWLRSDSLETDSELGIWVQISWGDLLGTALLGSEGGRSGQREKLGCDAGTAKASATPWSCKTGRVLQVAPHEPWEQGDPADTSCAAHTPGGSERRAWDPRGTQVVHNVHGLPFFLHTLAFLLSFSFSISFDLKANDEHVSLASSLWSLLRSLTTSARVYLTSACRHPWNAGSFPSAWSSGRRDLGVCDSCPSWVAGEQGVPAWRSPRGWVEPPNRHWKSLKVQSNWNLKASTLHDYFAHRLKFLRLLERELYPVLEKDDFCTFSTWIKVHSIASVFWHPALTAKKNHVLWTLKSWFTYSLLRWI